MTTAGQLASFLIRRAEDEYFASVRAEALADQRGIPTDAVVRAAEQQGKTVFTLAGSLWIQLKHAGKPPTRTSKEED